ncbi:hypothetical protein C4564_02110 [Candidatus Microgenomates bacterium]|nr:MAG: hypothetical protein C4564_02110 [Candidatus Microgenomates bacterium]
MKKTVEFKGRQLELDKMFPLTIRDWKELKKRGVTQKTMSQDDIEEISTFLHYVLCKADIGITQDDVDSLTPEDEIFVEVGKAYLESVRPVEGGEQHPTTSSSTNSPTTTDGQSER